MQRGEIRIKNETVADFADTVISRGVPLPPGAVREPGEVTIRTAEGGVCPSCGKVLQRRPDGSIEWILMDMRVDIGPEEQTSLFVETAPAEQPDVTHPVTVEDGPDAVTLDNGITRLVVPRKTGSLLQSLTIHGKEIVRHADLVDLEAVDGGGKIHRASLRSRERVAVTHVNRLRAVVRIEGKHEARDGSTFLDYALSFGLRADRADVEIMHTFYCREPRDGRIDVKAIRLVVPTAMRPDAKKLVRQQHHGHSGLARAVEIAENVEIVSSSVADIDNYRGDYRPYNGKGSSAGQVFLRNLESLHEDFSEYPFQMRPGPAATQFRAVHSTGGMRRVSPLLGWIQDDVSLVTAFRWWEQLHPKSIAIDEDVMTVSFWPEWSVPLQLVQGVSKTHTLWLAAAPNRMAITDAEHCVLRWEYRSVYPLDISFDPAWPAFCEVLDCQHLLRYQPDKYPLLENLIEPYPAAGNPNRFTYARHDASGMLNYGDVGGTSGYGNNEDDSRVFFPLQDYLRSGRTYAFDCGQVAAEHYMEVDFCEWSTDPRQNGGLIPHAQDHFVGNVYASHQWVEGILAYYYLTGDERARNVVVSVAENYCYWVEHVLDVLCVDGREAGMPLVNLAAAYRLTRDEKYLAAARTVIDSFHAKWFERYGDLRYPYPQHMPEEECLATMTGYGDWSSYSGMYLIWELTRDESLKRMLVALLEKFVRPENFNLNDARTMDFYAVWAYIRLTGDAEGVLERLQPVLPMLLRRGGHPLRRLHFLKVMDEHGLIDETKVGSRAGVI